MRKLSFLIVFLLTIALFSSCNNDEPENKMTSYVTLNNRAIEGDNVVFSQGNSKVEVDNSNMMIKFTADFKDANGMSRTITTPEMKMKKVSYSLYEFAEPAQPMSSGFESLGGYVDFYTGVMWYTLSSSTMKVVSSTSLQYAYTTTTIINPDNDNHIDHKQSFYEFALNANGQSCTMGIYNFIPNISGSIEAPLIEYKDLTMTPTATGYTITADEVESSYKGFYTITDLQFDITSQGQVLNGSFKCKDLEFKVTGALFPVDVSD
jgi:hypothetical protein